jgi:protein-tyrosine-phosphatase
MPEPIRSILLVCTGNTCRSPMAEALLTKRVRAAGLGVIVQSGGVSAAEGCQATQDAAAVVREYGADLTAFRSQPATEALVEGADLILSMTGTQLDVLILQYPSAEPKAYTLLSYAAALRGETLEADEADIADPLGGGIEAYRARAAQIDDALAAVIEELLRTGEGADAAL